MVIEELRQQRKSKDCRTGNFNSGIGFKEGGQTLSSGFKDYKNNIFI